MQKRGAPRVVCFQLGSGSLLRLRTLFALRVGCVDFGLCFIEALLRGHVAGIEDQDLLVDADSLFGCRGAESIHSEFANLLLLCFLLWRLSGQDDGHGRRWSSGGRGGWGSRS